MLQDIRKKTKNLFLTLVIVMVAVVMAFFGVTNKAANQGGGGVAAWVNGEAISRNDFARELEQRMYQIRMQLGGQFDERFLTQFQIPQNTLNHMVQVRLLAQEADRLNILIPDSELYETIRTENTIDGKFDAAAYRKIPDRGIYEKNVRHRLQTDRFQRYIADRVRMPPTAAENAYVMKETKIDLQFAKIDFNKLSKNVKPTAAQLDTYLKSTPEAELEANYSSNLATYSEPASYKIRQIRVGIPFQASADKKTESKKKIDKAHEGLTDKNFAERAKTFSDDEYAKKGGVVGWVKKGTLEKILETTIANLEIGKVSDTVETPFGYFILLVDEKKPEVVKKFADVKRQVAEKLLTEKLTKEAAEGKRKEWEGMLAQGKPLDTQLKAAGITLQNTGPFAIGEGHVPKLVASDALLDAVFELTKAKPVATKLIPAQDEFIYLKLVSVTPAKKSDYAKNAESVGEREAFGLQSELIKQWVANLQKTAKVKTEIKFDSPSETVIQ